MFSNEIFKTTIFKIISCEYCEIFKNSLFYRAPLVTAFVLWAVAMLNFNCVFENLRTVNDFNFTNLFGNRVMRCSMEGASYCCFCKAVLNNFFQQVLLTNYSRTYANLLQRFIFAFFLLIEDYGECALWKEPVIGRSFKLLFPKIWLINSIST